MNIQLLEQLGFSKEESFDTSDNDTPDFYYYVLDIGGVCLITNDSDDAEENGWYVELFEGDIRFTDIEQLQELITLLKKNLRNLDN
jgi:hypothetical protein